MTDDKPGPSSSPEPSATDIAERKVVPFLQPQPNPPPTSSSTNDDDPGPQAA